MKKKLLVVFFFSLILTITIYKTNRKETYTYLPIGDALAMGIDYKGKITDGYVSKLEAYLKDNKKRIVINKKYIYEDIRIKDLIEKAEKQENNTIQKDIMNANLITISIGSEELFSKLKSNYEIKEIDELKKYVDNMFIDYKKLLKIIRTINKKEIILIGLYNPVRLNSQNEKNIKDLFDYIDNKFKELEKEYKITYIEINNEFIKEKYFYLPSINNSFPTNEAYEYIFNEIKRKLTL